MYGYIYKTTNLINGKIYIGQHKAERFDTTYYGSGRYLQNALKKYGLDNFQVEVITKAQSKQELDRFEQYWIKYFKSCGAIMYNIANGGEGGDTIGNLSDEDKQLRKKKLQRNGYFSNLSKERRQEMSKKAWETRRANGNDKMSLEQREKLSISHLGNKPSKESIQKRIQTRKGYKHSQETIEKIREGNRGRIVSIESREKMSRAQKGKRFGKDNPFYGKHHSEETRQKLAAMNRAGICGMKGKHLTEEQKLHHSEAMKGKNLGTKWMNDGKKCFKVKEKQVHKYILKGYCLGRKIEGYNFVPWNKGLKKEDL